MAAVRHAGNRGVDISVFADKMPPEQRHTMIGERFPSTVRLDWRKAFDNDIELLGRILRDILKLEMVTPGRPGPRPGVDRTQGEPILDKMLGKDPTDRPYTVLPFPQALRLLMAGRSLRHFQCKIGKSKSELHRLLKGSEPPTVGDMEHIAGVFGKQPSYFLEYRVKTITMAIGSQLLEEAPDVSIRVYERLWQAAAR